MVSCMTTASAAYARGERPDDRVMTAETRCETRTTVECVATMWCPECRCEYREGFTECADCSSALVDVLPSLLSRRAVATPAPSDDEVVELQDEPAAPPVWWRRRG
jgi:hypothetical protein